jgi:hypothetical protein
MIHELSETLGKSSSGTTMKLYSADPFPNRADRKLGAVASDALAAFDKNPDATFVRQ